MTSNQSRSAFEANSRGIAVLVAAVVIGFVLLLQAGGSGGGSSEASDAPTTTVDLLGTTTPQVTDPNGTPGTTGGDSATTTTEAGATGPGETKVAVLNGSGIAGLAATTMNTIVDGGYQKGAETNAASFDVATTTVYFRDGAQAQATAVAGLIGTDSSAVVPYDDSQPNAGADDLVIVVLGTDFGT